MTTRLKRECRPNRGVERKHQVGSDARTAARHRTVDTLARMRQSGSISHEMYEAGRGFQSDFALAGLDPIRARPMAVPVGRGGASEIRDRQLDARRRVHNALEALGGMSSPAGSCTWHVLGCGYSVREWGIRRGWSGQPVRLEQAQGILIAALGVLATHYGRSKAKRAS